MKNFVEYCKDYILDHIEDYEGQEEYGYDWASTITSIPNIDGSLTYSTFQAKECLKEWWDECADYLEFEKEYFGQVLHNPFESPEAYMVCMVIEGVNYILSKVPIIEKNWHYSLEMDGETISAIKEFVNNFDEESLF